MSEVKKENSKESLSNTSMNVENGHIKGEYSDEKAEYSREPIENTPFWVIGNDKDGYVITMGKYRISQKNYDTAADANDAIYERDWNLIFNTIVCILRMDEEARKNPNGE